MKMLKKFKQGFAKLLSGARNIDAVEAVDIAEKVEQTVQKSKVAVKATKESGKLDARRARAAAVKAKDTARTIKEAGQE
jgi:DNA-binding protein